METGKRQSIYMEVGKRLTELRKARGLNQKECADDLRKVFGEPVETSKYNKWENGKNSPDYDTLCKLAQYFNTSTDYLLRGIKAENVAIYEKTGLSDKTIEYLSMMQSSENPSHKNMLKALNDLFKTGRFVERVLREIPLVEESFYNQRAYNYALDEFGFEIGMSKEDILYSKIDDNIDTSTLTLTANEYFEFRINHLIKIFSNTIDALLHENVQSDAAVNKLTELKDIHLSIIRKDMK